MSRDVAFETTLASMDAVIRSLERGPQPRPHPLRLSEEEARELDPRSDEQWFEDEQSPSDSAFR
ncbi:MAG: hypothetical protein ACT4O5_08755 [Gammaproteobacteria bacterium]